MKSKHKFSRCEALSSERLEGKNSEKREEVRRAKSERRKAHREVQTYGGEAIVGGRIE